jgi:hypothetical protein
VSEAICHSPRKIEPLPGCLSATRQRCGKTACRCARGELHGPYWSRFWREGGRRRRQYVRAADLERVRDGIAAWRRLHPPARTARSLLGELGRLFRQLDAARDDDHG